MSWGGRALLGLAGLGAVLSCEPTAVAVRANAAFSQDGGRVLLMEARFDSLSRDEPWTDAPSASNWRALFVETGPDLDGGRVLSSFVSGPARVKSLAASPLHWLDGPQVAVGLEEGRAVGLQMRTATRVAYALPEERKDAFFLSAERDLRGVVRAVAAVPSPDGARVAVLHAAAYEDMGVRRYVHAVSFHAAADGTFERAAALKAWRDSEESLQLDVPAPVPVLASGVPVPGYGQVALLWEKDSGGVLLVDRDEAVAEDGGEPASTGQAVRVDAATGAVTAVDVVPAWPLATSGGPVSPGGTLLYLDVPSGSPNGAEVRLHALDGGMGEGFFNVGTLPPADAGWAR